MLPEANVKSAVVTGLRVEEAEKGIFYDDGGAVVVLAGALVSFKLPNKLEDTTKSFLL